MNPAAPQGDPNDLEIVALTASLGQGRDRIDVLGGLDISVPYGRLTVILGPSGCGKTTLFNLLAGLLPMEGGRVSLGGKPVPHLRGRAAYMQQKDLLLPWRTLLDNTVLGLEIQGRLSREARRRSLDLMTAFGLSGFEHRYPDELSGGMRQRAALIRTVLCDKPVWLLDEPFGALDAITRRKMQGWLLKAWDRSAATVLLVTHDADEALMLADRIYVLTPRPARVNLALDMTFNRPRRLADPELVCLKESIMEALDDKDPGPGTDVL